MEIFLCPACQHNEADVYGERWTCRNCGCNSDDAKEMAVDSYFTFNANQPVRFGERVFDCPRRKYSKNEACATCKVKCGHAGLSAEMSLAKVRVLYREADAVHRCDTFGT